MRAAVLRGVQIRPRVETRIARLHRDRMEFPLQLAGLRIERLEKTGRIQIVAGADEDVIADDDRRRRRKVLLREARNLLVPALLAGARVEADEVIVRRLEEHVTAPDA